MPSVPFRHTSSIVLLAAAALASTGCASAAVRAAEQGKYEGLRASLAAELSRGSLGLGESVSFAKAVARREIEHAKGAEGAQRVRDLRSCAHELDDVLDARADTYDDIGAVAAMVRVEAGLTSAGHFSRWARTSSLGPTAAWRPLGARALVSGDDAELRRKLILDADEEVRRGALRAALEADDPQDAEAVLEAARVDPSPAARAQAIRAAGAIGGARAVLALKDLWAHGDDAVREALVDAWASHGAFNSGGRRELGWVVETQHGRPVIGAASILVRAGGEGAAEAAGVLERTVKEGPSADRIRAIESSPLRLEGLRAAIAGVEADPDEAVAVAALARRFEAPADLGGPADAKTREAMTTKLLAVAGGTGGGALVAKGALARAHEPRLLPILEKDGVATDQKTRAEAGTALAVLGDLRRAAVVAADPEPRVRVAVSCAILRAWAAK
jgi:hypothetical protein